MAGGQMPQPPFPGEQTRNHLCRLPSVGSPLLSGSQATTLSPFHVEPSSVWGHLGPRVVFQEGSGRISGVARAQR